MSNEIRGYRIDKVVKLRRLRFLLMLILRFLAIVGVLWVVCYKSGNRGATITGGFTGKVWFLLVLITVVEALTRSYVDKFTLRNEYVILKNLKSKSGRITVDSLKFSMPAGVVEFLSHSLHRGDFDTEMRRLVSVGLELPSCLDYDKSLEKFGHYLGKIESLYDLRRLYKYCKLLEYQAFSSSRVLESQSVTITYMLKKRFLVGGYRFTCISVEKS